MTMETQEFNSRETYIAWRAAWRERYSEQSEAIRILKVQIKNTFRSGGYAGRAQAQLHTMQKEATNMLLARRTAKEEAQNQYLSSKQAEAA